MNQESMKQLRVFFQDEDSAEILIPIPSYGGDDLYSLGSPQALDLPNGERLKVYAEVSLQTAVPDVLLSIDEGDKTLDVRCGEFVVVGYQTAGNLYVLFQIGTGSWERES